MPESPLRILVITSRPLIDAAGNPISLLDVEEERRRISTGLKRAGVAAHVHFLPEATTGEVKTALRDKWDVVHFTGHGTEDGRLVLEDRLGAAHFLSKEETAQLFTGQQAPLVVLSACHSQIIGQGLLGVGVPTVVAVDASKPIADRAAIIFAEHFYSALAKGWNIQKAFDEAQRAVALDRDVGDSNPPLDPHGHPEQVWSERFRLIGEPDRTIEASEGEYRESGARRRVDGNLRTRNESFVGRAKEISSVVKAFDREDARRVALWGAGGLGKTELSQAVAWWYAERDKVDAVLWASASRDEGEYKLRDLASLLSIAARVFKLPITEQSIFDEQKQVVRAYFDAHSGLLILDNWETIEGRDRGELWKFVLSLSETTRVLVTSRDVLPAKDARNIELDTLAPDDAVELFVNVARNAGYFDRNPHLSADEMAILSSISDRLSGYPLAIEVVAGQTVSRSLSDIWNDLVNVPKNVLEGKDENTGEPRGVWTSLDLSYNALESDDEKSMFRQMGILLAPASAEDIAAITEISNPRPVLDTLVKRSLVRMREGAYALLPIVRVYAESKLEEVGQDPRELHARAIEYYLERKTLEDSLLASNHLFELAARFNSRKAAEAFIQFAWSFYRDLVTQGYWMEAKRKAEQVIEVAHSIGDKENEGIAIDELGNSYNRTGESQSAKDLYLQAQRIFEESGNKAGIAIAINDLGTLEQHEGYYGNAERLFRQSLRIREELGDKRSIIYSLGNIASLVYLQGKLDEAKKDFLRLIKLAEEINDEETIGKSYNWLGMIAQDKWEYDEAKNLYNESLRINENRGDKNGSAVALAQLGRLALEQGKIKEAFSNVVKAYISFVELRSRHSELAGQDLAAIHAQLGEKLFEAWLEELSSGDERIKSLVKENVIDQGQRAKALIDHSTLLARSVKEAGADVERTALLAQELENAEHEARDRNRLPVADFFAVLRAMLAGEDVTDKIAALVEPFKGIAEQAQVSLK